MVKMINSLVLLYVLQGLSLTGAYDFTCPSQAHWRFRAKAMCTPQINYSCLFDVNLQVNVYKDKCIRPRILGPGYKYVFQPNPNRDVCSASRYQPFIFKTTGNSNCVFLKSHCWSEGQTTYKDGTTSSDITCTCKKETGYTFVRSPQYGCYCDPSKEDCSCYFGISPINRTNDCKDVSSYTETSIISRNVHIDTFHKMKASQNKDFDNFKYNIVGCTNEYRFKAVLYVFILMLSCLVAVGIYMLQRNIRQRIKNPKNIEVFGSSDSSITVEWDINESDNCLEYKLLYRPEGSDNWEEKLLSSTDVSTNKNRRCRYKIEALPPGTLFEFKMCSVENQVNSVYTKSTICQTLKLAPRNFDVFESTESSITVEWDILESNNCLEYELMYRPDHTDEWKEQFSSVKDVPTKKNGRYMYKIENLSSDTRFEVKMCCGENKRNSHYTRHVSCKTLKHGNEDVTEEGTRSKDQVMQELLKRTDSVPSNIREQMRIRINEWEDNSKNFVITKAYNTILEKIRSIDCVAVTGSSGSGKSAIVRQVSLTLCRDDGFEIITISTPVELKTYYTPGRKTMFVLEDLCGKFTANEGQINGWDLMKDVVDQVIKDSSCKLLFSCRLQVFHDPKFSMLQLFKSCECNLISDELCLDTDEKKKIFKSYFGSETTEDDILLSSNVNYPLLCQQMSIREDNPDIAKYFKTPYCAYKTALEELTIHAPLKICGLCLCIMFNNQLKERDFKILSSDFKTVVNDICEFFGLQLTPATSIRKELDIPDKTFVNKQDGVYKICHDNLFDFMAYYFGTLIPKCFIDHADSSFLRERFLWEKNIQSDKSSIENIVHLDDDFLVLYIDRLISDWLKGKVSDVFYNINMKYISFRKEFLKGLKRIDRNKATDLANIKDAFRDDFASGNTPLIISCLYGDVDLMKWLLEHSAKVNVQRDDGASALCMACEKNHEDAVSILLENNAKVNLCTEEGASPLGIACFFHGNSNIIRQLLKRNPDVNEFRLKKNNMTPLFMACKQNFNSAASLLLEHNADHRICLNNGMSALLMACHNRNTDIVRLLLQEGANPDAQKNDGNTPLFSAAAMGLDIITDLLLQNNADIYKYVYSKEYILQAFERSPDSLDRVKKFWVGTGKKYGSPATKKFISDIGTNALDYVFDVVAGSSPLHVACFMGQIKIVEKLIRTMPQVDLKKKQNGITPLFYACEIGHLVIIRSLLEKGADPTSCTGNQCSPLDKAKSNKHADVLLLLNSSHK